MTTEEQTKAASRECADDLYAAVRAAYDWARKNHPEWFNSTVAAPAWVGVAAWALGLHAGTVSRLAKEPEVQAETPAQPTTPDPIEVCHKALAWAKQTHAGFFDHRGITARPEWINDAIAIDASTGKGARIMDAADMIARIDFTAWLDANSNDVLDQVRIAVIEHCASKVPDMASVVSDGLRTWLSENRVDVLNAIKQSQE